jgi:hypothetical protein
MATTTPNFGWAVPTSTDLVKDGAVAIETLGDSIDASLLDLKGGTTGQVLKKNSNTDMDFVWGADSAGMTNPMTTTGDTIYSSSGSTPARLGIGTTGQVLTVASGVPSWATPAGGGGKVLQVVYGSTTTAVSNSTTTKTDTGLTATITPSSATSKVLVLIAQNGINKSAGNASNAINLNLLRGATDIQRIGYDSLLTNTALYLTGNSLSTTILDSPATTSATTYKTQFSNGNASASVSVQNGDERSTITLLEIGA